MYTKSKIIKGYSSYLYNSTREIRVDRLAKRIV